MARRSILTDDEHTRVSAAVTAAEGQTSGEIVTILTDRSDPYGDVALAWSAFAAILVLTMLAILPDFYLGWYERLTGGRVHEWTPRNLFTIAAVAAALKFAGVWLFQLWPPVKFLLIPPAVKDARVRARALTGFRIGAERRTHGSTGILIYLSMREHRAEIIADEVIAAKVDVDVWGEAMAAMLAHIRDGHVAEGMCAAVERVGAVLAEHFPRERDDRNELPDRLIEI